MCGCCVKVSLNLLANLLQRITDDIMELIYCQRNCSASLLSAEDQYQCHQREQPQANSDHERHLPSDQQLVHRVDEDAATDSTKGTDLGMASAKLKGPSFYNVIYDTVELEPYFCAVDRPQSVEILRGHPDGACLVRPFKLKHAHIRYILSVHAAGAYFHLFIRKTSPNGMYALGLEKQKERQFKFPSDIVQYYRTHRLECATGDKAVKIRLHLLPIVNVCANHPGRRRIDADDDGAQGSCDTSNSQ
ncbi:uncharacterized protein LOC135702840 [Ochlerotatus camptorhynchus]|uniref:uncharacterized protein LOC135702840 n=1 Tax=Ochlerotatus camptorhynchus TaxID=644619 RepID=UPI0031D0C532